MDTPYGAPSGPLNHGVLFGKAVVFLARHGYSHTIPPHKINYCANIWALKNAGVDRVIAMAAVGGIAADFPPKCLAIPDQIIDYTSGRTHTFYEEGLNEVVHVDFTYPYDETLRPEYLKSYWPESWVWLMPSARSALTGRQGVAKVRSPWRISKKR